MLMDQILHHFPHKNLRFVVAYGSGVFQQHGSSGTANKMIDFLFSVDDAVEWHRENIAANPSHYSFMKTLGPNYISRFQDRYGARVYYNTLIPCEGRMIKYGVIQKSSLINDLLDWESLYVSGRLQKPVSILRRDSTDTALTQALLTNLQSAVHASLLLLPEDFTEDALFTTLAGLSYSGDFRMVVGEDRNKVQNIVQSNREHFEKLYGPILSADKKHLHWNQSLGRFEQSLSSASLYHHLALLPKFLMFALVTCRSSDGRHRDTEEVLRILSRDNDCAEIVQRCIAGIVKYSSIYQSLKGLVTAGPVKSVKYASAKLKKMLN